MVKVLLVVVVSFVVGSQEWNWAIPPLELAAVVSSGLMEGLIAVYPLHLLAAVVEAGFVNL